MQRLPFEKPASRARGLHRDQPWSPRSSSSTMNPDLRPVLPSGQAQTGPWGGWSGTHGQVPGGRMVRHGHVPGRVWGGICFANRHPPGSRLEGKLPQRDRSSGLAGTSGMPPQVSCAGDGTGELAPSLAASVESSGAALAPHLEVPAGKAGARAPGEAAPGSHRLAQRDSRQGSYPLPPGEATWTKPAAPPGPPGEGGGAGGGRGSRGCR